MKLHATQSDGIFKFTGSKEWVKNRIKQLPDGEWDVTFKRHVKTRTNNQNAYYWAIVVPLVFIGLKDVGFDEVIDEEDAHEVLKAMFFKKIIYSPQRDVLERTVSTTKFSTTEFNERLELIWKWSSEYLGLFIPPPNSQMAIDYS